MSAPDELYDDAVKLVREYGIGTTRLLQVNLRIGWGRAWSLLETLTENGVLGPEEGLKPRKLAPAEPEPRPVAGTDKEKL